MSHTAFSPSKVAANVVSAAVFAGLQGAKKAESRNSACQGNRRSLASTFWCRRPRQPEFCPEKSRHALACSLAGLANCEACSQAVGFSGRVAFRQVQACAHLVKLNFSCHRIRRRHLRHSTA